MVMKARRMGGCMQNHIRRPPSPPPPFMTVAATPTPSPITKTRCAPTRSFHNQTLRSNRTDHKLTLLLPNNTSKSSKQISDRLVHDNLDKPLEAQG